MTDEARDFELRRGLDELAAMVGGAVPFTDQLTQVAVAASKAIPQNDGVSVVVVHTERGHRQLHAVGSAGVASAEVAALQQELFAESPGLTAIAEQRTVRSGSLGGDARWPRFGPRLGRLGIHSTLALPMRLPDQPAVGALLAYSTAKDAFDDNAIQVAEVFADPAAVAVHNAELLVQALSRAVQLQAALETRATIDQAIGILRSRTGGTAEEGFARLKEISQRENVKLAAVAERVVEEAVRRARARHTRT